MPMAGMVRLLAVDVVDVFIRTGARWNDDGAPQGQDEPQDTVHHGSTRSAQTHYTIRSANPGGVPDAGRFSSPWDRLSLIMTRMRAGLLLALLAIQSQEGSLVQKIGPLLPKPEEERWLQVRWRTDFAAARAEANREGKPIFLWMMDGNPLGCT